MGAEQSRSHELVLKSAAGDIEGVRRLLALYVAQQRAPATHAQLPAAHRIDIDYQLPEGDFALELATTHGHVLIVRLLLEHGANADAQDANGLSALMCAAHDRDTSVTMELLRLGRARTDLQDSAGQTALHHACLQGHLEQVRVLLCAGGDPLGLKDHHGRTAMDQAASKGQWEIVKSIMKHMLTAQAAAETIDGDSSSSSSSSKVGGHCGLPTLRVPLAQAIQPVLEPAARSSEWEVVRMLLEGGADPLGRCAPRPHVPMAASAATGTGGRVIDLFPSWMVGMVGLVHAERRCDKIITILYPFLVGSVLETICEYETECYAPPSSAPLGSSSAASASSAANPAASVLSSAPKCLALPRTLLYLQRQGEAADRAAEEVRQRRMAEALTSQALSSSPRSSSSSSPSSSGSLSLAQRSPFASSDINTLQSPLSMLSIPSQNHPSANALSTIAPPSQGSQQHAAGSNRYNPSQQQQPHRYSSHHQQQQQQQQSLLARSNHPGSGSGSGGSSASPSSAVGNFFSPLPPFLTTTTSSSSSASPTTMHPLPTSLRSAVVEATSSNNNPPQQQQQQYVSAADMDTTTSTVVLHMHEDSQEQAAAASASTAGTGWAAATGPALEMQQYPSIDAARRAASSSSLVPAPRRSSHSSASGSTAPLQPRQQEGVRSSRTEGSRTRGGGEGEEELSEREEEDEDEETDPALRDAAQHGPRSSEA